MSGLTILILSVATSCVNFAVMLITFPRRWKRVYTLLIFVAILLLVRFPVSTLLTYFDVSTNYRSVLSGFVYLPFLFVLFRWQLFQKLFAYFLQLVFSAFQLLLIGGIAEILFPTESGSYNLLRITATLVMFGGYITLVCVYGRRFFKKLFVDERTSVWGVYSLGAALSYIVVVVSADIVQPSIYFLILFFSLWSFAVLCFSIVNTHEKSKQRYEAEFAREVISSGREHYQKMDEMYDRLRTLRHDFKYHLVAIGELSASDNKDGLARYLDGIHSRLAESELRNYCGNNVINALLINYAERCAKLEIVFTADIALPETLSVPNFDLCIVVGNPLENAVEACRRQVGGKSIEIIMGSLGGQLALRVKNSFDGHVCLNDGRLASMKQDGGFGLRSVESVAERYHGESHVSWTADTFSTYVTMRS